MIARTLAGAAFLVGSTVASAETYPLIQGEFQTRIQSDYAYRAGGQDRRRIDTFTKSELALSLGLAEGLSIATTLKLEPVRAADGDRFLGDHGFWLEELTGRYETDDFSLFAGKFNPRFGFAFDKAPYIYGRDFVDDYETTEKIGFGGSVTFAPEALGQHVLTGALFFQDSTALSNSVLSRPRFGDSRTLRPGRLRQRDGGVGNTRSLGSATISLDGQKMPFADGLEYTLGYRHLKRGRTESFDENAFVAGIAYALAIAPDVTLTPMAEYVELRKFEGGDAGARYVTGALQLDHGPWSAATSHTQRRLRIRGDDPSRRDDRLYQVTVGYRFDFGVGLHLGWKAQKVAGVNSQTVGVMALYGFSF